MQESAPGPHYFGILTPACIRSYFGVDRCALRIQPKKEGFCTNGVGYTASSKIKQARGVELLVHLQPTDVDQKEWKSMLDDLEGIIRVGERITGQNPIH